MGTVATQSDHLHDKCICPEPASHLYEIRKKFARLLCRYISDHVGDKDHRSYTELMEFVRSMKGVADPDKFVEALIRRDKVVWLNVLAWVGSSTDYYDYLQTYCSPFGYMRLSQINIWNEGNKVEVNTEIGYGKPMQLWPVIGYPLAVEPGFIILVQDQDGIKEAYRFISWGK